MSPTVRFDREQRVLAFGDGSRAGRDRVSELPTLPISVLSQATVGELTRAMSMFAVGFGTVDDVEAKELRTWTLAFDPVRGRSPRTDEHIRLWLSPDDGDLRVVVASDVDSEEDPTLEAAVPSLVVSVAHRWSTEVTIGHDATWLGRLAVHAGPVNPEREPAELFHLGNEIRA